MIYKADLTHGALKVAESRVIADLLLRGATGGDMVLAIEKRNILQTKSRRTALNLMRLICNRLSLMGPELWKLVRDGSGSVTTHALLAAAIKHSRLLGDFLKTVVAEQYRLFNKTLPPRLFDDYLGECRERDPEMPQWNDSTCKRLRSTVFQALAQAGYIDSSRARNLQNVHVSEPVRAYLRASREFYVLGCMEVTP